MNDRVEDVGGDHQATNAQPEAPRRPYSAPRLVAYGSVAKLTQTGGLSVKDFGSMKQAAL